MSTVLEQAGRLITEKRATALANFSRLVALAAADKFDGDPSEIVEATEAAGKTLEDYAAAEEAERERQAHVAAFKRLASSESELNAAVAEVDAAAAEMNRATFKYNQTREAGFPKLEKARRDVHKAIAGRQWLRNHLSPTIAAEFEALKQRRSNLLQKIAGAKASLPSRTNAVRNVETAERNAKGNQPHSRSGVELANARNFLTNLDAKLAAANRHIADLNSQLDGIETEWAALDARCLKGE